MLHHDETYLNLVEYILTYGVKSEDRTGTGTLSVFGPQMRFDLTDDKIPLLTTKRVHTKSIIHELLWFLSGDTNIQYLKDNGVRIWDEWADEDGNLGPVYGHQWRNFGDRRLVGEKIGVDQITNLVESLTNNPESRRHIVSAWNPVDLPDMALPPCHCLFQCYVKNGELSLQLYQRSADVGLGVPFNIASYSMLARMLAQVTGLKAKEFIWTGGDTHIYLNHVNELRKQLKRLPKSTPRLRLAARESIFDFKFEDFTIEGYNSHPTIKMKVSV